MPLFKKGSKSGLTSTQIVTTDLKSGVLDTDLAAVSGSDDTLASAKAIKAYVDTVSGVTTLTGLSDTTIASSPADNNHLQYDGGTSKWVNRAFIDFDKLASEPDAPDAEEGRLYVKQIDGSNNALAVKIKKATAVVEVELTSPGAICGECGREDGAKDPTFNFQTGTIIVELYCGHTYEMDIPAWRRI